MRFIRALTNESPDDGMMKSAIMGMRKDRDEHQEYDYGRGPTGWLVKEAGMVQKMHDAESPKSTSGKAYNGWVYSRMVRERVDV